MARDLGVHANDSHPYIFISYNSGDADVVGKIITEIEKYGVNIWYDRGIENGSKWEKEIALHISEAEIVIFFVTKGVFSKEEPGVRKEYDIAKMNDKKKLLVMLDDFMDIPVEHQWWWSEMRHIQSIKTTDKTYIQIAESILIECVNKARITLNVELMKDTEGRVYLSDGLSYEEKQFKGEIENVFKIKYEYPGQDCTSIAKELCNKGIISLDNKLREKFYLLMNCNNFEFENIYLLSLLSEDIEELNSRIQFCKKYVDMDQISIGSVTISTDRFDEYEHVLKKFEMNVIQVHKVMKQIIKWGDVAKRADKLEMDIQRLSMFDIATDSRNEFVANNASEFCDDYSRHFDLTFQAIIDSFGKEEGFQYLNSNPSCMRWGFEGIL